MRSQCRSRLSFDFAQGAVSGCMMKAIMENIKKMLSVFTILILGGLLVSCCAMQTSSPEIRQPAAGEELEAFWDEFDWDELTPAEQELWGVLGWNQVSWDEEAEKPASEEKDWDELSAEEQSAAQKLGYTQEYWDAN